MINNRIADANRRRHITIFDFDVHGLRGIHWTLSLVNSNHNDILLKFYYGPWWVVRGRPEWTKNSLYRPRVKGDNTTRNTIVGNKIETEVRAERKEDDNKKTPVMEKEKKAD